MRVFAAVAPFDRPAQNWGPTVFDSLHQTVLVHRQAMRLTVGGSMLSKDVGQLQSWRLHDVQRLVLAERLLLVCGGCPIRSSGLRARAMALGETAAYRAVVSARLWPSSA